MKLDDFWEKLLDNLTVGKTFLTLYNSKNFGAYAFGNQLIIIPYSTRKVRYIKKNEFTRVWTKGKHLDEKIRFKPTNYVKTDNDEFVVNASYILALIFFYLKKYNTEWE